MLLETKTTYSSETHPNPERSKPCMLCWCLDSGTGSQEYMWMCQDFAEGERHYLTNAEIKCARVTKAAAVTR